MRKQLKRKKGMANRLAVKSVKKHIGICKVYHTFNTISIPKRVYHAMYSVLSVITETDGFL